MDRFLIKKGQKPAQTPNENQHEDAGEGTSRQTSDVPSKKRKVRSLQDEHRKFQGKWTDKFLFILHGMNPLCLICKQTRACFKRSNLERHFKTAHPNKYHSPSWTQSRCWPLLEFGLWSRLPQFETTCTESDVFLHEHIHLWVNIFNHEHYKEETEKPTGPCSSWMPHCDCNNKLQIQHEESQGHACQLPLIPVLR